MIKVGVIGFGYWGPNVVRNFCHANGSDVSIICDKNPDAQKRIFNLFPGKKIVSEAEDVLNSTQVDVVAIVTPVSTHYTFARKALENGKHVFVEKPFTATVKQAEELIELAEKKKLKIMVDHTFLFTGAVRKIRELIDNKVLGEIYYFDSSRINLGLFQHDVNVIWDLAPHDFSIMLYLLHEKPIGVTATGMAHVNDIEDIAYITVHFDNKLIAHFTVNWLSPVKVRNVLIGGEKKMLVWNDVNPDEKIKVYDKGVDVRGPQGIYELLVSYRSGDIWAPKIDPTEALQLCTQHFIDCINKGLNPISDGKDGLKVVKLLEACDESMKHKGKYVKM